MPLYESVFIVRQEVSSNEVDKLTDAFSATIKEQGGSVEKQEYWGLRNLAYEISNNRKGHYMMLCINAESSAVKELERKMKLSEDVVRFMTLKTDKFSDGISPILKTKEENVASIDVTVMSNQE